MTNFVPSITEDQVLATLRSLLLTILPSGVEVIQGQDNQVAEPTSDNFVMMVPLNRSRIMRNIDTWATAGAYPTTSSSMQATKVGVQLDFHGASSTDLIQTATTLFYDEYTVQFFANTGIDMSPLYMDDPVQAPFINGENQYETRYTVNAFIEINAVVTVPQQFATNIDVGIYEVDVVAPPD